MRQTKKGAVEVAFRDANQPSGTEEVPPADPEAEIQSMVDVESARPSLPRAIRGRLEIYRVAVHYPTCEDGRTPAIEGWCGDVNDAPGFQGEVLKKWGGGKYEAKGIDKNGKPKAIPLDLGGYSLPIPNTPSPQGDGFPSVDQNMGFGFSGTPGFEPSQTVYQDEEGNYVASPEASEVGEDLGWVWSPARNQWIWKGRGMPPSRPPRLPGVGASSQNFNLDHSQGDDDRVSRLEKLFERFMEQPREDPRIARLEAALTAKQGNDAFANMLTSQTTMQANQMQEAQRQRDHELKLAQLKQTSDDAERKARATADSASATRMKELELEAIKAKAAADQAIAAESAKTAQANATAMISSNERIAQIQADANSQVLKAVTASADRGNGVEVFARGMEAAASLTGSKSTVESISHAAETLIPSIVDGVVAVKTMNAGGQPVGGAPGPGGETDESMTSRFVSLIATLYHRNTAPNLVPGMLGSACLVSGVDASKLIDPLISIGTPAAISAYLEAAAAKATDEAAKKKMLDAKAALTTDKGRAWFAAVRTAYMQARKGGAQPQVSTQAAGQIPGPGPSTPGKN